MEPIYNIPMLRHVALEATQVAPTFVALPDLQHPRVNVLSDLDVTVLPIANAAQGQSVSLRDAVVQLPECAGFLVVLADMPDLTAADMASVIAAGPIARGMTQDGKPGHPVWFDAKYRSEFQTLTGDSGAKAILKNHNVTMVPLNGNRARRDIDTPEEWKKYRSETGR
ncbi:NTP transferase domain-containing protein [Aestuariibius sp. HNIBRBA575]|uniref:nucleotidyltransferase family protein n=1 Tax=Aestuariibius sp. HNIBRBA575 TaxID=3233343 RepID=UPI0034A27015